MQRELFTAEHEAFRETVRTFLAKEVIPHHERWEQAGIVDREAWLAAGRQGLLGPACSLQAHLIAVVTLHGLRQQLRVGSKQLARSCRGQSGSVWRPLQQAALLLMGALLLCTVMLAPQGFVLGVSGALARLLAARGAGGPVQAGRAA